MHEGERKCNRMCYDGVIKSEAGLELVRAS